MARNIIIRHLAECDCNIDYALTYADDHSLDKYRAEHTALWRVLLDVDHAAAMEYRNNPATIERARRVHHRLEHGATRADLERAFDERIAPNWAGFDAATMAAVKESYITNRLDNHYKWYEAYIAMFGETATDYNPERLLNAYRDQVADGDTPEEAFIGVVCCALERDL